MIVVVGGKTGIVRRPPPALAFRRRKSLFRQVGDLCGQARWRAIIPSQTLMFSVLWQSVRRMLIDVSFGDLPNIFSTGALMRPQAWAMLMEREKGATSPCGPHSSTRFPRLVPRFGSRSRFQGPKT